MIHSADIREWRDCDVVDPKGHRIGSLEAIYVHTATDEPAMATVLTGLPTRRAGRSDLQALRDGLPARRPRRTEARAPLTAPSPVPEEVLAMAIFLFLLLAAVILGLIGAVS